MCLFIAGSFEISHDAGGSFHSSLGIIRSSNATAVADQLTTQ